MLNKTTAVLGSTGSVGTQALDVCRKFSIRVKLIAANSNVGIAEEQIREFQPEYCILSDENKAKELKIKVSDTNTKILSGYDAISDTVGSNDYDIVYNAISGKNGLMPTLAALESGKTLALANKESMVLAGQTVNRIKEKNNAKIIPVDSEHCAIFQCLQNGKKNEVKRILLTASGGPFFGYTKEKLCVVTVADTLKHPTWNMGRKITVDSATLANKGLEIIEAMHLFDVSYDQIEVLIHRQSIVHSMVEFKDNSVIAQLSTPDMRYPCQYALTYPDRVDGVIDTLDFTKLSALTFDKPDFDTFKMLPLAIKCASSGGIMPCVYNGANEIAVAYFLSGEIGFFDIFDICNYVIENTNNIIDPQIVDILEADKAAREMARVYKEKFIKK